MWSEKKKKKITVRSIEKIVIATTGTRRLRIPNQVSIITPRDYTPFSKCNRPIPLEIVDLTFKGGGGCMNYGSRGVFLLIPYRKRGHARKNSINYHVLRPKNVLEEAVVGHG